MSKITQLYGEFKDIEELKKFAEAQHATITELSAANKQLEEKLAHVEQLLVNSTHIISSKAEVPDYSSNEEKIARDQLRMFAGVSRDRELTLEETRKVEIYSKIIISVDNREKKKAESGIAGKTQEELLELVKDV